MSQETHPDDRPVPRRSMPASALHMQHMLNNPQWGDAELSNQLSELQGYLVVRDKDGNIIYDKDGKPLANTRNYWDLLRIFTRDLRLANIDRQDLRYCEHYLHLAGDVLRLGNKDIFTMSLRRVIVRLELSQSLKGFLRKLLNTLRQEQSIEEHDATRRSLIPMGRRR